MSVSAFHLRIGSRLVQLLKFGMPIALAAVFMGLMSNAQVQAQAQSSPVFFKVHGTITNGDQFDPGALQGYSFDTSTGGGSKSRKVPNTSGYGNQNYTGWGTLSVSASIGSSSATISSQGSMDPVDQSRSCNLFYGCGWSPDAGAQASTDVYVLGNPGTKFHLVETESGNLDASVTKTSACNGGWGNAQASASWSGFSSAPVSATTEHGTGGFCGIPVPKSGSAPVSGNRTVDGTSTGPTITYNGQTYSYASSVGASLSLHIYAEQDPDFTAHSAGNVTVNVNVTLGPGTNLALLSGDQQTGSISSPLTHPLVVKATNPDGTPASGLPISFAIGQQPSGASGAALTTGTATTAPDGTASTQLTLGDKPGQYQVTASCAGGQPCMPSSVTFTETAHSGVKFDYTMPSRFGPIDPISGLVKEPAVADPSTATKGLGGSDGKVDPDFWPVNFRITAADGSRCDTTAAYTWKSDGSPTTPLPAPPGPVDPCQFLLRFDKLGTYSVTLTTTPSSGQAFDVTQPVKVNDALIVSIGDSTGSGEGNPDIPGNAPGPLNLLSSPLPQWEDRQCHRSARAPAALAALNIGNDDPHTSVTFVHVACSGASIRTGLLGYYNGQETTVGFTTLPPQLSQVQTIIGSRSIDALIVQIGANDIAFGSIVKICASNPTCASATVRPVTQPFEPTALVEDSTSPQTLLGYLTHTALPILPLSFDALFQELHQQFPTSVLPANHVYLAEYFDPTHDQHGNICGDGTFPGILGHSGKMSQQNAQFAHDYVVPGVDGSLIDAVGRNGWDGQRPQFIAGIASSYQTHGWCAGPPPIGRWITNIPDSFAIEGLPDGAMHPNYSGQIASSGTIQGVLESNLGLVSTSAGTSLGSGVAAGSTALPVTGIQGFNIGDSVSIDVGANAEVRTVTGFGSLDVNKPLLFAHAAGAPVVRLPRPVVDTTAPTTVVSLNGVPNGAGWNNQSPVTATLIAQDNPGGTGVRRTYYALDDTSCAPPSAGVAIPPACQVGNSATVTGDGRHTLLFFSVDAAGNFEAQQHLVIDVDSAPPTLTFGTPSPAPNVNGWNNSDVTIPCTPADALSGVATVSPACPLVLKAEGGAVTGTVTVTDVAGNTATFTSTPVKIDKTPPVTKAAASPLADAGGVNNTDVSVTLTATDNLSGPDRTEFNVDSSGWTVYATPVVISTEGTHALQFRTTDKAGNVEPAQMLTVKIHKAAPPPVSAGVVLLPQPQRVVDTRTTGGPIASGASRCFTVAGLGGIPGDAAAVLLNVTTVGQTTNGWATVYPMGQAVPATSTLNSGTSEYAIANNTMTRIGSGGQVCVNVGTVGNVSGSAHVILDATGYLSSSAVGQFPMLASPQRLVDTRASGGPIASGTSRCFQVAGTGGVPADAAAVVLNVTSVGYGTRGWLTAYPGGQPVPPTSTLNFDTTAYAMANGAIVRLGSEGQVCISVGTLNAVPGGSHVILDATGYLTNAALGQVPMLTSPERVVDTRLSGGPIATGTSRCFTVAGVAGIPASATGVVLNVTAVGYSAQGWLTAYPAGQAPPATSTLNFDTSEYAMANGTVIGLGTGGQVCISTGTVNSAPGNSQVILDVVGYLAPPTSPVVRR